jgi:hypothetical protein
MSEVAGKCGKSENVEVGKCRKSENVENVTNLELG